MTHSRIPKFTKLRPFGVPQTPFNPKSGKYVALGNEQWIIRVVVERKIEGAEHLYVCSVIDERGGKSGEQVHAHRLVLSSSAVEEIAAETVTFAYYIDKKWWIRGEEESTYAYVDFLVEEFDRADADSIGDYWENDAKWSIRNQRGYESGSESVAFLETVGWLNVYRRIASHGGYITWTTFDPPTTAFDPQYQAMATHKSINTIDVLYKAVLSNADHNIKIIANSSIPATLGTYPGNHTTSVNFEFCVHVPSDFQERGTRIHLCAGERPNMSVDGPTVTAAGFFSGSCSHGGSYYHSASQGALTIAGEQVLESRVRNNDDSAYYYISEVIETEVIHNDYDEWLYGYCNAGIDQAYSRIECENYKNRYSSSSGISNLGLVNGENTFYFEVRGDLISGWCNGTQIFKSQSLYTLSAGMFGLRGDYNFLTLHQTDEAENYISRIKVWTADVPEPPDGESGHGTYDDGQSKFNYADKYHAGGDYNPDA